MKKFLSFVLCIALISALLTPICVSAENSIITFGVMTSDTVVPGKIICLDVYMYNNPGVNAFGLQVNFDTRLTYISPDDKVYGYDENVFNGFELLYGKGTEGSQKVLLNGPAKSDITEDGKLLEMHFSVPIDAKEGDEYVFSVSVTDVGKPTNIDEIKIPYGCDSPVSVSVIENGWFDYEGDTYYYVNGNYVTGLNTVDGGKYIFADDGKLIGPYENTLAFSADGEDYASVGGIYTLELKLNNNPGFSAVGFEVKFDGSIFNFIPPEETDGVLFNDVEAIYGDKKDNLQNVLLLAISNNDITESGTVLNMQFSVSENAIIGNTADFTVSVYENGIPANFDEEVLPYYFEGGKTVTFMRCGWFSDGNDEYYYDINGNLLKGKAEVDGVYYLFDEITGKLIEKIIGFVDNEGNKQYYDDGVLALGWKEIEGSLYYFNTEDGNMINKSTYINRIKTEFTSDGKCLGLHGDVTGDFIVDATDLVRIKKHLAGNKVELGTYKDVTGDSGLDSVDLVRLKKFLAGQKVSLD